MAKEHRERDEVVQGFEPDYAVPPGWMLEEALQERHMSQAELGRRTGLSARYISRLIRGQAPLTADVAWKLELATGVSARLWNNLERGYREDLVRLSEETKMTAQLGLLDKIPVSTMVAMGLLTKRAEPVKRLKEALAFFGVADQKAWEKVWSRNLEASFRNASPKPANSGALAVWLRLGERQVREIPSEPWDRGRFREALTRARGLTVERNTAIWIPQLVAECARAGVVLVSVPDVRGVRAKGAARWLSPDRALIQMGNSYRWSDVFWFSFFHEARHVLDETKRPIFLNCSQRAPNQDEAEERADAFARDFLIPPRYAQRLEGLHTPDQAQEFAGDLGVHPGIVVGRLQHDQIWPPGRGDRLRQPLEWAIPHPAP